MAQHQIFKHYLKKRMKKGSFLTNPLFMVSILFIGIAFAKCTKQGTVASTLDRSVVTDSIDSTLFSPFYDSTLVPYADAIPDANDYIIKTGVLSIIKSNCSDASCHGGKVSPTLTSYTAIKSLVVAGSPEASRLWQVLTTNDLNKAMPPINISGELSLTEKNIIYNWIKNGAKERPDIADFRPTAIRLVTAGCTSGNCHNEATAVGYWARNNWISYTSNDTATLALTNLTTGAVSYYPQMANKTLLNTAWQAYKDSVRKFYADTLANASFRPWKYFSGRGPLNTYDDIILDVNYPKSIRSSANAYKVNGVSVNCKGDYLNGTSSVLTRIDSTILLKNPRTGVWATSPQAQMTYSDGGFGKNDIPIIKAWYFSDSNVPDTWKFGSDGSGIFKFRKSGNIITKH
jgi:Planctomycete cytochrome C.